MYAVTRGQFVFNKKPAFQWDQAVPLSL